MKKVCIYILLFFYVAVQLKPLTAVVQDVLAHTFFKMQHMATVHYENGKYHLHTELEKITNEDGRITKEKTPPSQKSNEDLSNQIIHELNFDFTANFILTSNISGPNHGVLPGYSQINSPPPKKV